MAITPEHGLLTVDEYYQLVERGVLSEYDRVELVEGKIVAMPPIGPRHAFNVTRLTQLLIPRLLSRALVSVQNPVTFGRRLERQPDLALLRLDPEQPRAYERAHPTPADVLLLVEVADTSVDADLVGKARQYAAHGVVELWVVDLPGDRLVVHREPTPDGYASVTTLVRGQSVSPLAFPDLVFTTDEILG